MLSSIFEVRRCVVNSCFLIEIYAEICYKISRLTDPLGASLASLLVFGPQLLALSADGRRLLVWDAVQGGTNLSCMRTRTIHLTLVLPDLDRQIQFDEGFTATHILHPATYLNKVVVASSNGDMQLWNVRTQQVSPVSVKAKPSF